MGLKFVSAESVDPYRNIAVEDYLLDIVGRDEIVLYLWQNDETVVIGRNQNVWSSCRPELMSADGVRLARRYSGGGSVYHDLGNLNFSFIAPGDLYDQRRQYDVVIEGLARLGIHARLDGRNDISVGHGPGENLKCSGSAFRVKGERICHHGTLLVRSDIGRLERYLAVDAEKIRSKGVGSVSARVVNLTDLCPSLTVSDLTETLADSFSAVYGSRTERFSLSKLANERLAATAEFLRSRDWLYGRQSDFGWQADARFGWGGIRLLMNVTDGTIADVQIFSDALDTGFIESIPPLLRGCVFSREAIAALFAGVSSDETERGKMRADVAGLLLESF